MGTSAAPAGGGSRRPLLRGEGVGVLLIVLAALTLRGVFLVRAIGNLDADNATIGLMASHILQGHHYAFFWGLAYMGSLEAYVAAMYFAALGPGDVALQLAPLTFSVAFLVSGYLLARQIGGVRIGVVALGLLAVGPPALTLWNITPRGGYAALLAFGTVALLLATRIAGGEGRQGRRWIALGLVAGLGLWSHLLTVVYLVAAAYLLLAGQRWPGRSGPWLAVLSFGLGSLPLWIHNVGHGLATLALLTPRRALDIAENVRLMLEWNLPGLLGARSLVQERAFLALPLVVILLGVPAAAVGHLAAVWWRQLREGRRPPEVVLGLLIVATLLASLLSPYGGFQTQRYLLPIFSGLPILTAVWLGRHLGWFRGLPLLGLVLGIHLHGHWTFVPITRAEPGPQVEALKEAGIRNAYAEYWTAGRLTYYSGESLVVSDLLGRWYPLHERASFSLPAVILTRPDEALADALRLAGVVVEERTVGPSVIYQPVAIHGEPRRRLDRRGWRVDAWPNGADAWKALDGDPRTRWGSASPQRAGMWFLVDLGGEVALNGIVMDLGPYTSDFPRTIAIDVSRDGSEWRTIAAPKSYFRPGVLVRGDSFRFHPSVFARRPILESPANSPDIRFAPVTARFVKAHLPRPPDGEISTEFDWSIAELVLYAPPLPE